MTHTLTYSLLQNTRFSCFRSVILWKLLLTKLRSMHTQTYQSNYESGLRILRIEESPASLTEVAYFDVFPSRTEADFYGTWSNYPWLLNGTSCSM